jgi:hypothetical protein
MLGQKTTPLLGVVWNTRVRCVGKIWEFVINEIHEVTDVLERIVKNIFRLRLNQISFKSAMYNITKYIIAAYF